MSATEHDVDWPAKLLSTEDTQWRFPHGPHALKADLKRVREIHDLRAGFLRGHWVSPDERQNYYKVDMSFAEAFIFSDAKRIALKNRVTTYHRHDWKREAIARVQVRYDHGSIFTVFQPQELRNLVHTAEQRFAKLMDDLVVMQGLTAELQPETRELTKRCTSLEQLLASMLNADEEAQ